MKQIYISFKTSEYRPEPIILIVGMLGVALLISSLIVGIAQFI